MDENDIKVLNKKVVNLFLRFLKENNQYGTFIWCYYNVNAVKGVFSCINDGKMDYPRLYNRCVTAMLQFTPKYDTRIGERWRDYGHYEQELKKAKRKCYTISQKWRLYLLDSGIIDEDKGMLIETLNTIKANFHNVDDASTLDMIKYKYREHCEKYGEKYGKYDLMLR